MNEKPGIFRSWAEAIQAIGTFLFFAALVAAAVFA